MKNFIVAATCAFAATAVMPANAQELKLPALSPTAKLVQDFSTSQIEITYSRPSMRGRKIMGGLVAYGQVWRTGANSATKIKFTEDLNIGGQNVKAGEYAIYTVPGRDEWEVILNKGTGNWGVAGYETSDDVARFKIKPKTTSYTTQTFTINISDITFNTCNIDLKWENTKVTIPVKADNQQRLNASIEKAINEPNIPYHQAANYYFETEQNLDKALTYTEKALEQNPKAFWTWHLRARIAQKMNNKQVAMEAAQKSIEAAKGSAFEHEYVRNNNKIINAYKK